MIEIRNISKIYNKGTETEYQALKDVSLRIYDGDFISIEGRSGAGKSTLLHILGCIDRFTSGSYLYDDIEIEKLSEGKLSQFRNRKIGFVLQDFALIQDKSVLDNVSLPLYFGNTRIKDMKNLCLNALSKVGMLEHFKKKVNQLSGGQKQRVAIARALVNEPDLILADEPTGALDSITSLEIMELLKSMNENGKTIIVVTHDSKVSSYSKKRVIINDGKILDESTYKIFAGV